MKESIVGSNRVQEVRGLLKAGYSSVLKPFLSTAFGYRDILLYLSGAVGYAETVTKIKQETRHYAKKQITWFSREEDITWFEYPENRGK